MGFVELLLIGVGLSMDAFAVAICKGLAMRRIRWDHTAVIALAFGGFQALMPFRGWWLAAGGGVDWWLGRGRSVWGWWKEE